jgi:hydantoinase/carbamoylase family amidase
MLGVVTAIECVAALERRQLPFAIEVIGFGDEEGVRFGSTLLGSRAVAGTFDAALLERAGSDGVTLREALRAFGLDPARVGEAAHRPREVLAYVELHIEQGPVLEAEGLPVGVVTAINGGYRFGIEITGMAGHAGTVPMSLRRDALAAAAECVLAVEAVARGLPDVVATVGRIDALRFGKTRDEFQQAMVAAGVPCTPYYPHTLYGNPLYREGGCRVEPCPVAEETVRDAFWFPHRVLMAGEEDIREVARVIRQIGKE